MCQEVTTEEDKNTPKQIKRQFAPHRRVSIRICKNCGRTYVLNDSDAVYFIKEYGSLPLRCEACRERNKQSKEEN